MKETKAFLLYKDSLCVLDAMTDEQAGNLFKAIKAYQCGEQFEANPMTKVAIAPFIQYFKNNKDKYKSICNRNKINGLKGGRPKGGVNPNKPTGLSGNPNKPTGGQNNPNKPDTDTDTDTEDLKSKTLALSRFDVFWKAYPKKKNKGTAEKVWKRLHLGNGLFDNVMEGLKQAKVSEGWKKDDGQFIPYPATWLNAKGWEDEYDEKAQVDYLEGLR